MMLHELQVQLQPDLRVEVTVWDPSQEAVQHTFESDVEAVSDLKFRIAGPGVGSAARVMPLMITKATVGVILHAIPSPYLFYPVVYSHEVTGRDSSFWLRI